MTGSVAVNVAVLAARPLLQWAAEPAFEGIFQEFVAFRADRVFVQRQLLQFRPIRSRPLFGSAMMDSAVDRGKLGEDLEVLDFLAIHEKPEVLREKNRPTASMSTMPPGSGP